jgi:hypothetical protein
VGYPLECGGPSGQERSHEHSGLKDRASFRRAQGRQDDVKRKTKSKASRSGERELQEAIPGAGLHRRISLGVLFSAAGLQQNAPCRQRRHRASG